MLENIKPAKELRALASRKRKTQEFKTIPKTGLEDAEKVGWELSKKNKHSFRVARAKSKGTMLEDRVWNLLYLLGFKYLSAAGGAFLCDQPKPDSPKTQLDNVAIDDEVALAVECKTANSPRKSPEIKQVIEVLGHIRSRFAQAVQSNYPADPKRVPLSVLFTHDIIMTDNDIERAKNQKVALLNENDLEYYEKLAAHLGPAAKYQFFADMLPGRQIHGLELKVPALKTKMGKHECYTFSITPEYLLKVAYVSHRAKGKATDIDTYQRMIKKSRLKKIRQYISDKKIFPTNIVVSLTGSRSIRFESREKGGSEGADYGMLILKPAYKSAWIIDGQHRLYAYSGHEYAKTAYLSVLAFKDLPPSVQAQLFIDINHEQKSVKKSLLHELYAELNWDAEDIVVRINAVVSKLVRILDQQKDSPFYGRILFADDRRTDRRCITLEALFKAISSSKMFIVSKNKKYGPLWAGDTNETLERATKVLSAWFFHIQRLADDWWEAGAGEGGGLAMNDGVTAMIGVLKSVLEHLDSTYDLVQRDTDEVVHLIKPFGEELGRYLANHTDDEKLQRRKSSRGVQGQNIWRRICEMALNEKFTDFRPEGLEQELAALKKETNKKAYEIIKDLELNLNEFVVYTLMEEYPDADQWFFEGVDKETRKKVLEKFNDDEGQHGYESYFDLIDYRKIVLKHWELFKTAMDLEGKGKKEDRTKWMYRVNEIRKKVMHEGKGRIVSLEELSELEDISRRLTTALGSI